MKPSLTTLKTLLLALLIAVGVSYASAAWQPAPGGITPNCPTDTADTNYREGCNPPINVSATAQIKKGDLALGLLATSPNTTLDIFGKMKVANDAIFLGNVGVGVVEPNHTIDTTGDIHATNDICTDLNGGVCLSALTTSGGGGNGGNGLGVGQKWIDMKAARMPTYSESSSGFLHTYQYINNTGQPIFVSATVGNLYNSFRAQPITLMVDGINIDVSPSSDEISRATVGGVVPAGSTYSVVAGRVGGMGTPPHYTWTELRSATNELVTLDAPSIATFSGTGARGANSLSSEAKIVSNYIIVPTTTKLTPGKTYAYIVATEGCDWATRFYSSVGTKLKSRGYNGCGGTFSNIVFGKMKYATFGASNDLAINHQGTFRYNPTTITSSYNTSSTQGVLIANETEDESDPGKGNWKIYIYETSILQGLMDDLKTETGNVVYTYNAGA